MEDPVIQPAPNILPYLRYNLQTGAVPSSCKPSPPFSNPPIVAASPPGVGPLAPFEAFLLGYYQTASTLKLTEDQVVLDYEHSLWCIPTLVSSISSDLEQSAALRPNLRTDPRTGTTTNNNSRSPEIGFPPLSSKQVSIFPQHRHDDDTVNELYLKPPQGLHLENRSLTSLFNAHIGNMTTTTASAPGSPPDLAEDRSSKGSSYSSTFSSPDGLDSDTTNFEEIGLDDERHQATQSSHSRDDLGQSFGSPQEPMRTKVAETVGNKAALSQLQTHGRAVGWTHDSTPLRTCGPRTMLIKRGLTSQEALISTRTRSSSPRDRRVLASVSTASLSAGGLRPVPHRSASSFGVPERRASWQPQRKTVQELEAEYHDSDDELPEDASLWNVPVSPFTPANRSNRSSLRGSPERDHVSHSPRPIPLAHAKTAPETPPRATLRSQTLPKQRSHTSKATSYKQARSNPSSPRRADRIPLGRTKSWNFAMADLSEEARIISEALEYYAEARGQEARESLRGGSSRESLPTLIDSTSRTSSIQLPPIQKSTLDFMPISKEKEAVLSRTRPSWLPPKDPKEERRHLREYRRMMAASMGTEKKHRAKLQTEECEKDGTRDSLHRIWQYYVADSTDLATIDQRVNNLCWRGISPSLRGKVWQRALGNPLGLTRQSYESALRRAREIKKRPSEELGRDDKGMERWFVDIERDAETAFPELQLFQRNGLLWQDLVDLCEAYACYRSDVGYIYGIQLIAALLLLQLPSPADAFVLLANCLNRPVPLAFQINDTLATGRTYHHAVSTLATKYPRLHEYLFGSMEHGGLGFTAEEVFEPMLRTIFSNGLDVDRLCRVWDVWVFEGDRTLVPAAVAILGSLQPQLFEIQGDVTLKKRNIQETLGWGPFNRQPQSGHWDLQALGGEDRFMEEVRLAGTLDYAGN
ncbi:hypothetical protein A1O1_01567 [Capronia coronata CBS 617.96]|uniref:Rab-GAP TBC domain-containing protein n=1 Tax=Capronia coronata CBS 617.96 TaxID=1182541 RepID=W9Z4C8_9EURO|nr:uncharacterized protein A1O1_01567 [Capronia coronata CBS 617.96]EXJ96441.1 hypothetical protein A1O1_01567 [Capronia coronata CBS 617.96]